MTTTAMTPSLSCPLVQVTHQRIEDRPKRPRAKNVSWATEDKICQVRLFAAEDAPSLSGTVLQDLLQAKQTRFMHAVIPVSADDLPPGFEGVAAKRARLDTEAIVAMVTQTSWRCSEKFVYDPLWQVVAGGESTEVSAQQQREVRVLEAVYPRPSAIPPSPAEPQETPPESDDALIPQIPLIPVEDDDEGIEDSLPAGTGAYESSYPLSNDFQSGVKVSSIQYPDFFLKDSQKSGGGVGGMSASPMISKVGQPKSGSSGPYLRDADPNIAAAAAAAYAVVKAKESGTLIDHDLLIKILSNPVLIETLTASNQKLKNQLGESVSNSSSREMGNGSGYKVNNEQLGGGSYNAASTLGSHMKPTTLPVMHGRHKIDPSFDGRILQGAQGTPRTIAWDGTGGGGLVSQGRSFTTTGAHEQSDMKGLSGHVKGTFGMNSGGSSQPSKGSQMMSHVAPPQSRSLPPRQDHLKELIQQHGVVRSNNEAQLRHGTSVPLDEVNHNHEGERHRAIGLGSRGQPWVGNNQNPSSLSARSDIAAHDRSGTEIPRTKTRKPCLYFNTPRGCRNGMNCNFLHEPAPEKPYPDRTRTDVSQLHQAKKPKVDTAEIESK